MAGISYNAGYAGAIGATFQEMQNMLRECMESRILDRSENFSCLFTRNHRVIDR